VFYPLKIFPLPCTSANSWPVLAGEGKRLYHHNMEIISPNYLETAGVWEQDAGAGNEVRESMGAVEATCLEQMMLVCMDLRPGYRWHADVAEDRT
jgi:hypothetical protein